MRLRNGGGLLLLVQLGRQLSRLRAVAQAPAPVALHYSLTYCLPARPRADGMASPGPHPTQRQGWHPGPAPPLLAVVLLCAEFPQRSLPSSRTCFPWQSLDCRCELGEAPSTVLLCRFSPTWLPSGHSLTLAPPDPPTPPMSWCTPAPPKTAQNSPHHTQLPTLTWPHLQSPFQGTLR